MRRIRQGGGYFVDSWHEALEQRVMLDSAFAAVGYYNAPDLLNGGTHQVMYALEGELDEVSNTLTFRMFTSADDTPVEQTASVVLDEHSGYFEVGLFGNGETQKGVLSGPSGNRTGWLNEPAEEGQPEEMSWWVERSDLFTGELVRHQTKIDAFRGIMYRREAGSSATKTYISDAFFNVDTTQGNLSGVSLNYPTVSFDGAFNETSSQNKYQWDFGQTDPAWLYLSGNGTQYVAVQFGEESESAWISTGLFRELRTQIPPVVEDFAGDYRVVRASDDVAGVAHPWATDGDEGVLTLAFDPTIVGLPQGANPAQFVSARTGERYTGFWISEHRVSDTIINLFFEPDSSQVGLERYAISIVAGGFNSPVLLGIGTLYQMSGQPPQVQPTRLLAVRVGAVNAAIDPGDGSDPGGDNTSNEPPPPPPPANADEFIEHFQSEHPEGFALGDAEEAVLGDAVPGNINERTPWGAENHWFQASNGDVWSLWHGGPVHLLANGEHMWTLTNLAEAAGLVGRVDFEPGSMSGVLTRWRAFSIQGIVDGQLVSLWWSPESALHEWGHHENGWVLTPFTRDIVFDADTDQLVETLPRFRSYTDTQHNGRYAFDPRERRTEIEFGMSVVLVDENNNVYAATFSTADNLLYEVPEDIANVWRLERLNDVPGVANHKLLGTIDEISFEFVIQSVL